MKGPLKDETGAFSDDRSDTLRASRSIQSARYARDFASTMTSTAFRATGSRVHYSSDVSNPGTLAGSTAYGYFQR